jgi:hypothetical protein
MKSLDAIIDPRSLVIPAITSSARGAWLLRAAALGFALGRGDDDEEEEAIRA